MNNLVFSGLKEETNNEDKEGKLQDFIYYELESEKNNEFNNVQHRFGRFSRGKDRPIVARFLYHFPDLVHVLTNANKLQGKHSRGVSE